MGTERAYVLLGVVAYLAGRAASVVRDRDLAFAERGIWIICEVLVYLDDVPEADVGYVRELADFESGRDDGYAHPVAYVRVVIVDDTPLEAVDLVGFLGDQLVYLPQFVHPDSLVVVAD